MYLRGAADPALTRAAWGWQPADDLPDEVDMKRVTSDRTMTVTTDLDITVRRAIASSHLGVWFR